MERIAGLLSTVYPGESIITSTDTGMVVIITSNTRNRVNHVVVSKTEASAF